MLGVSGFFWVLTSVTGLVMDFPGGVRTAYKCRKYMRRLVMPGLHPVLQNIEVCVKMEQLSRR